MQYIEFAIMLFGAVSVAVVLGEVLRLVVYLITGERR